MNPRSVVFVLGSADPEMRAIRWILGKTGYRYAYANRFGRRCNSSNAYNAAPGVRIVVASPIFPKKAYRGRKETGRAVLFT